MLGVLAQNTRHVSTLLATRELVPAVDVPLDALRARADREREGDRPRDLDLVLLCAERMHVTLGEMRASLSK